MFGLIATLSLVVVGAHSAVFSDDFAYNNMLPLAAAAYSDHPDACVRNHFNGQIYRFYKVDCKGPWSGTASVSCAAYTALLPSRKAIVLSFRGTNTPMQLFKELVHCRLSQEQHSEYEIWITGHSLGGALASLAASYLVEKRFAPSSKIKLMTFGQPRTGDEEFADRFNKTIDYAFRVIHANDGVPHVPPEKFGYRHHKQEVYYSGQDIGTNYLSQLKNEVATSAAVVPMGSGEVSWYFYNAFSNVWGNDAKGVKGLERAFKNQIERHPKYEIWVTVLSLGGAMASLAAYHIAKTYNKISERINERIKLVTFGEPRTGNAAYAEDFNKKVEIYIIIYTACSNTRSALLCQYTMSVY
ncbi:unnamed protein product [Cylicocyclus nassatus]|uniref:Fungal lipase-type domain-containing protein n=1 Tax=Cylicocyclus nassatus TaxID=53992 RepID=A0AA36GRF1_CYLNA|nr:unnamed protein product [Cylicocyclus nassatus]